MEIKNKYNNSCIYKIWKHNFIYIGSTCNFKQRMYSHKYRCNNINSINYNNKIYQTIRLNGGWNNFEKEIIENVSCNSKKELCILEGNFIKQFGNLNSKIAGRTYKEYRIDNREIINNKKRKYREINKERISKKRKEKIVCPICGIFTVKCSIKRHQRSKKCLQFLTN